MTATSVPVPQRRFTVDAAIPKNRLVAPDGTKDKVTIGGATGVLLGMTLQETFAAGDEVTVELLNKGGTLIAVASEAIAMHAEVFAAAQGKVAATGTVSVGYALDAASGDGNLIEIVRV